MRRCGLGSLALAAFVAVVPSAAAAETTDVAMSDGRTYAHWAHPVLNAHIRRVPLRSSGKVGKLHPKTEDGYPEVYSVQRRLVDKLGHTWFKIGVPGRPNGRSGWVRDYALGPVYRVATRLVIDRTALRATLYRAGSRVWTSRIGVGAPGTPTPAGQFWVREKFRVAPGGSYGPRAIGTSNYSTLSDWPGGGVIGIHGTDQPGLIPGRPSHGCVRVPNAAIVQLYRLLPIGTPVVVSR